MSEKGYQTMWRNFLVVLYNINCYSPCIRELAACEVVNAFLVEMCVMLVDDHQTNMKELARILQQGLPFIKGRLHHIIVINRCLFKQ